MTQKQIFIFGAIVGMIGTIIIIGFGIYTYVMRGGNQEISQQREVVKSENEVSASKQEESDYAKSDEELALNVARKNASLINDAYLTANMAHCDSFSGEESLKQTCIDGVLFAQSVKDDSVAVCEKIANIETRNDCEEFFWNSVSQKKGKKELCLNISTEEGRVFCNNNFQFKKEFLLNPALFDCAAFSDDQMKSDCVAFKADQKNCELFVSTVFKEHCLSE
ncbi:MAG: hypothetical protein HGA36_00675 [Candidatus Moranbacteria bacterium]|nr:hypothetical protein [Candidatus Moranbacteria bacterium]